MFTILLVWHVMSVVLGVGGALIIDIYMVKHLRGAVITAEHIDFVDFTSRFVKVGLIAIWASGIAIVAGSADGAASVLANPKLQAKLVIVVVLTLNALFIETLALPLLKANVGGRLFDKVSLGKRIIVTTCGAISGVSWFAPLGLGLARDLNHIVPASLILCVYLAVIVSAALSVNAALPFFYRKARAQISKAVAASTFRPQATTQTDQHLDDLKKVLAEMRATLPPSQRPHREAA